ASSPGLPPRHGAAARGDWRSKPTRYRASWPRSGAGTNRQRCPAGPPRLRAPIPAPTGPRFGISLSTAPMPAFDRSGGGAHSPAVMAKALPRLFVAPDTADADAAANLARVIGDRAGIKIGLELFVALGPEGVRQVRTPGQALFLDLKLHDIPNTVAGAVRAAADMSADLLSLHASGG